jgi:Rrf2 family protein
MIRLSTRGRYGLRAMIGLAEAYGSGPLMMSELCAREGLSRKYVHALLSELKAAGLVLSRRGARGGYLLSRPPGEIRAGEIVAVLEGDLHVVDCVGDHARCPRSADCAARNLWRKVSAAVGGVLGGTTLSDLLAASPPAGEA